MRQQIVLKGGHNLKSKGLIAHVYPFHLFVIAQPLKAFLLMCLSASLFLAENQFHFPEKLVFVSVLSHLFLLLTRVALVLFLCER